MTDFFIDHFDELEKVGFFLIKRKDHFFEIHVQSFVSSELKLFRNERDFFVVQGKESVQIESFSSSKKDKFLDQCYKVDETEYSLNLNQNIEVKKDDVGTYLLLKYVRQKPQTFVPPIAKKQIRKGTETHDLHAHKLIPNGMLPLERSLFEAEKILQKSTAKHLLLIHGIGTGILKAELEKLIRQKFGRLVLRLDATLKDKIHVEFKD